MNDLKSLLPQTEIVLRELSIYSFFRKFTFVGGSALAIYLNHRKSEDLDFFTWEKEVDTREIISCFPSNEYTVISQSKTQFDLIYKGVKLTFFANNWSKLQDREQLINEVYIAPLTLLAVMKVNTLFLRAKYRDYYDIYLICKRIIPIEKLFEFSMSYIPGLNIKLFQVAVSFVDDIEDDNIDHLFPEEKTDKYKIEKFFLKEIKRWNKAINTKK